MFFWKIDRKDSQNSEEKAMLIFQNVEQLIILVYLLTKRTILTKISGWFRSFENSTIIELCAPKFLYLVLFLDKSFVIRFDRSQYAFLKPRHAKKFGSKFLGRLKIKI